MRIKLFSIALLFVALAGAQTKVQPIQLNININTSPPETSIFFSAANQTSFTIPSLANQEVSKVVIYRNGIRQTDIGKITLPARNADYTLSTDKKVITFVLSLLENETILVDYWVK